MIVHWHTGFTCSGLSCSRLGLLTALLLHVEKSTQWWCGSISSCANVPGKELARKSCPKSTMASVKAVAATVVVVLLAAASSQVEGQGQGGRSGSRRYHMRKQREQWKVPSLEEVRLYIVKRSNVQLSHGQPCRSPSSFSPPASEASSLYRSLLLPLLCCMASFLSLAAFLKVSFASLQTFIQRNQHANLILHTYSSLNT